MKIYKYTWMVGLLLAFAACQPFEEDKPDIGPAPTSDQLNFIIDPNAENPNMVRFTNTYGGIATWDFGNGGSAKGDIVDGPFPLEGTYTVTMTVYDKGGNASTSQEITIEETNYAMLETEENILLTGGIDNLGGKTWVIDATQTGHFGVGPDTEFEPVWWQAPPMDKEGLGLYDDEYTFLLDGLGYIQETNGDLFVQGDNLDGIPGTVGEGDQKVAYDAPEGMNWSLVEEGDRKFINISKGGNIGTYVGTSTFEIVALEENRLMIRALSGGKAGDAWYHVLVPKGFEHPVVEIPYQVKDIYEDFEGNTTINWVTDEIPSFGVIGNTFDPFSTNTSPNIGMYVREAGEGAMWTKLKSGDLGYKMDLRERNQFKMKVYFPSSNDYVTEDHPGWSGQTHLSKKAIIRLWNSQHPEPWTAEINKELVVDQLDEWVELTFDFSEYADRTEFDQIVIQFGGEGHFVKGVFYFDDLELL